MIQSLSKHLKQLEGTPPYRLLHKHGRRLDRTKSRAEARVGLDSMDPCLKVAILSIKPGMLSSAMFPCEATIP